MLAQVLQQRRGGMGAVGGAPVMQQQVLALHLHQAHGLRCGVGNAASQLAAHRRAQADAGQGVQIDR